MRGLPGQSKALATAVGAALPVAGLILAVLQPAGDMRASLALWLAGLLAIAGFGAASAAPRSLSGRFARAVLVLSLLGALAVSASLAGSWDYYAARAATWRGDYTKATELLENGVRSYAGDGITIPLPIRSSVRVSRFGVLLASEAEIWLGIARNQDYLGNYALAHDAYQRALTRSYSRWSPSRRAEVTRMMDVAGEKAGFDVGPLESE